MVAQVAVDTQFMREVNSSTILSRLRDAESMSVSALAGEVGLSRQAVSRSLSDLEAHGLVEFSEPDRLASRSGRPPQLVRFRAEAGYVLGIYINPQQLRIAVSDLVGTVVHSDCLELAVEPADAGVVDLLIDHLWSALRSAKVAREDVWFASIGAPGIVDPDAGVIKLIPSMPGLSGDVLVRHLQTVLDCPVYLDNDVKLATQGERWRGTKRDDESLVFVHWGERIGAGILLHGRLFRGASNDAGDIGFLDLMSAVPLRSAADEPGQNALGLGPFEEWVGADAIVRLAIEAAQSAPDQTLARSLSRADGTSVDVVIDAALTGNTIALQVIDEAARRFASAVAAIRVILDPELLVIGGPIARCGDLLLEAVASHLSRQPLGQPTLAISTLGDDAVVQGAIHHSLAELERAKFQRKTAGI
jgi:predicted NBD/HSP70 family sugar kinase